MIRAAVIIAVSVAALAGCRKKQEEILRQQSSKWTEEQKKFQFPELDKRPQPKKPDRKGDQK